jgi:hypothetical protein
MLLNVESQMPKYTLEKNEYKMKKHKYEGIEKED